VNVKADMPQERKSMGTSWEAGGVEASKPYAAVIDR